MTVFEVVSSTAAGGTSGEASIALDRPRRRRPSTTTTLVADAGLIVPATLMVRLGLEGVGQRRRCASSAGSVALCPGRKILTLVAAIFAGGSPHRSRRSAPGRGDRGGVAVPGDGTVDVGHVPARRSPSAMSANWTAVIAETIRRAWSAGAGPGDGPVTIDWTRRSVRSTARPRLAPPTATPEPSATTRCWPPGPTPARCSTPDCARARRSEATSASSKNSSPGSVGPAPPGR